MPAGFFAAPAFCNIAQVSGEKRCPVDLKGGNGELDENPRPIASETGNLNPMSQNRSFAGLQVMGQSPTMLCAQFRWNDQLGQLLPECFSAFETENTFSRR